MFQCPERPVRNGCTKSTVVGDVILEIEVYDVVNDRRVFRYDTVCDGVLHTLVGVGFWMKSSVSTEYAKRKVKAMRETAIKQLIEDFR